MITRRSINTAPPSSQAAERKPAEEAVASTALKFAGGVVFDGSGNLWVANDGGGSVVEYTSAQLGGAGGT